MEKTNIYSSKLHHNCLQNDLCWTKKSKFSDETKISTKEFHANSKQVPVEILNLCLKK